MNPYLAQACICEQFIEDTEDAIRKYNHALTAGILKIASKMGVSTLQAYQSAQLFEAIGLDEQFVEHYFTNTPVFSGNIDLSKVEADSRFHHDEAFTDSFAPDLTRTGRHKYRSGKDAEEHLYSPKVIQLLQHSVWTNDKGAFDEYALLVENEGLIVRRASYDPFHAGFPL